MHCKRIRNSTKNLLKKVHCKICNYYSSRDRVRFSDNLSSES